MTACTSATWLGRCRPVYAVASVGMVRRLAPSTVLSSVCPMASSTGLDMVIPLHWRTAWR